MPQAGLTPIWIQAIEFEGSNYLSLSDAKTLGARMHPSHDAHRQAAREIADELKKLLHLA